MEANKSCSTCNENVHLKFGEEKPLTIELKDIKM
jgi:hypothetical protein